MIWIMVKRYPQNIIMLIVRDLLFVGVICSLWKEICSLKKKIKLFIILWKIVIGKIEKADDTTHSRHRKAFLKGKKYWSIFLQILSLIFTQCVIFLKFLDFYLTDKKKTIKIKWSNKIIIFTSYQFHFYAWN